MIIIFLGLPGSGKGTQAKLLAKQLGINHYSIGELLRKEYEKKSKVGIEGEKYWGEKGVNVPTKISFAILKKYLNKKNGFILDNFPRTRENLIYLRKYLKVKKLNINFVIHLRISNELSVRRLLERAKNDKKIARSSRLDETRKLIKIRQKKGYAEDIKEIIAYFKKEHVLYNISGQGSVFEINQKILNIIKKSVKRRSY